MFFCRSCESAAVNGLKICRMDRHYGRAQGGDNVFLLVTRVNKRNISVRLFELNDQGDEVWSAFGQFLPNDVHYQYAIVFTTPAYRDLRPSRDVRVFIELLQPSDGRTSKPLEFVYKAFPLKKRRLPNSWYPTLCSSFSGSLMSVGDLPTTVETMKQSNDGVEFKPNVPVYHTQIPSISVAPTTSSSDSRDALCAFAIESATACPREEPPGVQAAPLLSQPNLSEPPVLQLSSSELERLIDELIPSEEFNKFCDTDWTEYLQNINVSLLDEEHIKKEPLPPSPSTQSTSTSEEKRVKIGDKLKGPNDYDAFYSAEEVKKEHIKKEPLPPSPSTQSTSTSEEKRVKIGDKLKGPNDYDAFYSAEEVKKLVKEIYELIKNKRGYNEQIVRTKLERIFDLKLTNGNTFLHVTLCTDQSSFNFIVRLVHSLEMVHVLNKTNDLHQSILHLAVMNDMPSAVQLLVAKGCDPTLSDNEGNNAIHFAVICQSCLEPLLEAIRSNGVACDLNAYNQDKQTALHLAAIYDSELSARLLLQYGASYSVTDGAGRTALHLAAYDGHLAAMRALVEVIAPGDVDAADGRGRTALQIVCGFGSRRANSVEMIKLLLEKKETSKNLTPESLAMHLQDMGQLEAAGLMRRYASD